MTNDTYTIADLARLTGVNVRTIRYYLSQGLLPASGESGPGAHYDERHLNGLRLTKRLQAQHLPLAEIRGQLEQLSDAEMARLVEGDGTDAPAPTTSALDYVLSLLGKGWVSESRALFTLAAPDSAGASRRVSRMRDVPAAPAAASATAAFDTDATDNAPPRQAAPERSQWERLSLGPNIELHLRRPLSRIEQKRVERLITIARQVLKEDTP